MRRRAHRRGAREWQQPPQNNPPRGVEVLAQQCGWVHGALMALVVVITSLLNYRQFIVSSSPPNFNIGTVVGTRTAVCPLYLHEVFSKQVPNHHISNNRACSEAALHRSGSESKHIGCTGALLWQPRGGEPQGGKTFVAAIRLSLTKHLFRTLQAAHWLPRHQLRRESSLRHLDQDALSLVQQQRDCRGGAPVPVTTATAFPGDGCSRFIEHFCSRAWKTHNQTRHLDAFRCLFPSSAVTARAHSKASEPWIIAQSVGNELELCPNPAVLVWPAGKATYRGCSAAIARLAGDDHPPLSNRKLAGGVSIYEKRQDVLFSLQSKVASTSGLCPPASQFLWTPDAELWPKCEEWLRIKCPRGSSCDVPHISPWSSLQVQRIFGQAQNWCAGRGKCPYTSNGRFRPGALFYPDCSSAISRWCDSKGSLHECNRHFGTRIEYGTASDKVEGTSHTWRVEAQKWAHGQQQACPHPETEFLWQLPTLDFRGESSQSALRPRRTGDHRQNLTVQKERMTAWDAEQSSTKTRSGLLHQLNEPMMVNPQIKHQHQQQQERSSISSTTAPTTASLAAGTADIDS